MDGGNIDDVKQLLVKLAVIAEQLDTRSRGALQRIDTSATALDRSAQRWTEGGEDFSRKALETIGAQARDCSSHWSAGVCSLCWWDRCLRQVAAATWPGATCTAPLSVMMCWRPCARAHSYVARTASRCA